MKQLQAYGKTDIKETDKEFVVDVDLPGCAKDEVKVSFDKHNGVCISAKHEEKKEQKDDKAKYLMRERTSQNF